MTALDFDGNGNHVTKREIEMRQAAEEHVKLYSSDLEVRWTIVVETLTGYLEHEFWRRLSYVDQEKSQGCFPQCGGIT